MKKCVCVLGRSHVMNTLVQKLHFVLTTPILKTVLAKSHQVIQQQNAVKVITST